MIPVPGGVTILARPPCPDWLRSDDEIVGTPPHQSVYRFSPAAISTATAEGPRDDAAGGDCRILDIGAGSGLVAEMIASTFPGKTVEAVDVSNRILPTVRVPFSTFDGQTLPFDGRSFDCVLLANVLHHVKIDQRRALLTEALRVTGGGPIVIKDHLAGSPLDHIRLACLDFIGNAPFGGWSQPTISAPRIGPNYSRSCSVPGDVGRFTVSRRCVQRDLSEPSRSLHAGHKGRPLDTSSVESPRRVD